MTFTDQKVVVVIPALNEEGAIGAVVAAIDRKLVDRVIVVDNGSKDETAARARQQGAEVLFQPRRGYGSACLLGIRDAAEADVLVFLDGDGSDDASEIGCLLEEMQGTEADLVIGSRTLGQSERGALSPLQHFGNALTCHLVRWFWQVQYTDLGPFRAIRKPALDSLQMQDPDFGWTIEMQVKAAQQGLRIVELPVSYRLRRAGKSKVSGNLLGSYRAGKTILGYVMQAKLREWFS